MEVQYSNILKIHKLSKTQYDAEAQDGLLDTTALYLVPEEGITFNNSGSGAASGTTFDGTYARTISYNTIGAAASGHTHTCSITNSSGSTVTSLAHGTTYTLTAGGSSTSFTLPSDNNTDTKVTQVYSTTNASYPLLLSATSGVSSTSSRGATTAIVNNQLYANPSTGYLTATNVYAVAFVATSDKRLKENIKPYSCEKSILELPVYTYNFIADDTKTKHIGCIAQELQEICPELVKEDEKGYLSINESKLVYLLLDEVKKLKAEVNQLKLDCKNGE